MENKQTNKSKLALWISLVAVDVIITGVLFVISIIMLANTPKSEEERQAMDGFIGYLVKNPNVYLWAFVVPLFVLLAANIVGLVIYVRKTTKKDLKDLTAEQKEALRQELLKDLVANNAPAAAPAPAPEAPKAEEPKPEEKPAEQPAAEETPKE